MVGGGGGGAVETPVSAPDEWQVIEHYHHHHHHHHHHGIKREGVVEGRVRRGGRGMVRGLIDGVIRDCVFESV